MFDLPICCHSFDLSLCFLDGNIDNTKAFNFGGFDLPILLFLLLVIFISSLGTHCVTQGHGEELS